MSELVEKELNDLKNYLINEYRANGGTKDLKDYSAAMITNEIDNLKKLNELKKQLTDYKSNTTPPKPHIGSVNQSRENQTLAEKAARVVGNYMDYVDPVFDLRAIEDERYLTDKSVIKLNAKSDDPSVMILRDVEGRMA
jgi:hypothetical protein